VKHLSGLCLAVLISVVTAGTTTARAAVYSLTGATGFGYDSNAFLTPGRSYFDPFVGGIVSPRQRSGFFVPLEVKADHAAGEDRLRWLSSLDFRGKQYVQQRVDNADTYRTVLFTGAEYLLRRRGPYRDRITIGPTFAYNREIYVDRDTGLERTTAVTAADLGDRYIHHRYGLKAELRMRTTPVKYALRGEVRRYDYKEVPVLSSLDHLYYRLGATAEYDLFPPTTLGLGFAYFVRDFEDRPPRDRAGDLVLTGPDRKYKYYDFDLSLGQKVSSSWKLFLDYELLLRDDDFVGYNDYTRHRYRVRARYRDGDSELDFVVSWWKRDYPRAFAFDDPAFPRKGYETWEAKMTGERPMRGTWKLWAEYEYINQNSVDPRYEYDRHQIAAGVKVEL
jgi:hypothetical protein